MEGQAFTQELRRVSKCMQQAQHRALAEIKLPRRWPTREEIGVVLECAAQLEWKMERVQYFAERHFIIMNASAF